MIRGRLLTLCLPLLAILGVAAGALAFWTTQGTGSASATVGKLNAPTEVSVPSTASGTVHVSWTGSTLGDGATRGERLLRDSGQEQRLVDLERLRYEPIVA